MSNALVIHPTQLQELPALAELWYDKMALLQATGRAVRLQPAARQTWQAHYADALATQACVAFSALRLGQVCGGIVARLQPLDAGLDPAHGGIVEHLLLDLHAPSQSDALARQLLAALCDELRARGVRTLQVRVWAGLAVEQAFWLAAGAQINRYELGMRL